MAVRTARAVLLLGTQGDAAQAIAGELARAGDTVIGADFDRLPLGLRSRHVAAGHRLPEPRDPASDDALVDLVRRTRPAALLPLGTRAVTLVSRNAARLAGVTALAVCSPEAFATTYDHASCRDQCEALGIGVPEAYTPDEARVRLGRDGGATTLVVKPRVDVGAARGVRYVRDPAALDAALAACRTAHGEAIVQEFIPGEPDRMRAALLVFDARSRLAAALTLRKIRQWPPSGGVTAIAESTDDRELVDLALPFFERWRWRGVAEVEAKLDPRDGRLKVIEINGRLPAYARFASLCGLPLGRVLVDIALGHDAAGAAPYPACAAGQRYVNPGLTLRTLVADWRAGGSLAAAMRRAAADARGGGAQLAAMLADPAPLVGRTLRDWRERREA